MGIRQSIKNFVSYLSSDDIEDDVEIQEEEAETIKPEPTVTSSRIETPSRESRVTREQTVTVHQTHVKANTMTNRDRKLDNNNLPQTTIALKFPKKYEDAREIVDLLSDNECVLIDFQYMLDAQARRCIDFIDGASKVLEGNLRKVSSSMFLLTPSNIIVDIEELSAVNPNQDFGFDFDMKAR